MSAVRLRRKTSGFGPTMTTGTSSAALDTPRWRSRDRALHAVSAQPLVRDDYAKHFIVVNPMTVVRRGAEEEQLPFVARHGE